MTVPVLTPEFIQRLWLPEHAIPLVDDFLRTAKGRGKLRDSCLAPAQMRLDFSRTKTASALEHNIPDKVCGVQDWITRMEAMDELLGGEDVGDKARFDSLLGELKAQQAVVEAARKILRERE